MGDFVVLCFFFVSVGRKEVKIGIQSFLGSRNSKMQLLKW